MSSISFVSNGKEDVHTQREQSFRADNGNKLNIENNKCAVIHIDSFTAKAICSRLYSAYYRHEFPSFGFINENVATRVVIHLNVPVSLTRTLKIIFTTSTTHSYKHEHEQTCSSVPTAGLIRRMF